MKQLTVLLLLIGLLLGAVGWLLKQSREAGSSRGGSGSTASSEQEPASDPSPSRFEGNPPAGGAIGDVQSPAVEVDDEHAFYFRGPEEELNIPARSLVEFVSIAEQADDRVWSYHLMRGDYSRWFRDVLRDERLAERAEHLAATDCSRNESRTLLRAARGAAPMTI